MCSDDRFLPPNGTLDSKHPVNAADLRRQHVKEKAILLMIAEAADSRREHTGTRGFALRDPDGYCVTVSGLSAT